MNTQLEQVIDSTIGFHGYYIYNNIEIVKELLEKEINIKGFRKVMTELECFNGEYSELTLKVYEMIGNVKRFNEQSYIYKLIQKNKH